MGDLDAVKQVPGVVDSLRSVKTVEDQHQALEIHRETLASGRPQGRRCL